MPLLACADRGTLFFEMMNGVRIVEAETLGGGIAKVNIQTGVITVAKDRFYEFPEPIRRFVLLHELGHYVLQSRNELDVDRWALRQYMITGGSAKQAVFALTRVLSFTNPEHRKRLYHQLDRVRHYDYHINGNINALKNKPEYDNDLIRPYPSRTS